MAHSERSNNLIHAVFESRKLPKARTHNDLRDSLIALGDRDRSRKRQLAKLHRWACYVSLRPKPFVTKDDNSWRICAGSEQVRKTVLWVYCPRN